MTALFETATGPMVAILFWITVFLMVMMTFAHGKFFDANVFEAFGAVGQVGIAAALLWLGWQQFQHAKAATAFQERLGLFELKKHVFEEFRALQPEINKPNFDYKYVRRFSLMNTSIRRVFSAKTGDQSRVALHKLSAVWNLKSGLGPIAEDRTGSPVTSAELASARRELDTELTVLAARLSYELPVVWEISEDLIEQEIQQIREDLSTS